MEGVALNRPNEAMALQPLLQMARECVTSPSTLNVSTVRTLILKALSDPQIFAGFDQMKRCVQPALDATNADSEVLLRTLDLFSYGSYRDYAAATAIATPQYISLNESQLLKLRQLTVISLVQQACNTPTSTAIIAYSTLANELGFEYSDTNNSTNTESLRKVEEVVISCVYARILSGQLCQKTKCLELSSEYGPPCRARDIPLHQVSTLLDSLVRLQTKLQSTITGVQVAKSQAQSNCDADVDYWRQVDEQIQKTSSQLFEPGSAGATSTVARASWGAGSTTESTSRSRDGVANRQTKRSRGGFSGPLGDTFGRQY